MICRELGRKEKESLQKMAEIAKEGFLIKQQLIQEAKRGLEDKKVRRIPVCVIITIQSSGTWIIAVSNMFLYKDTSVEMSEGVYTITLSSYITFVVLFWLHMTVVLSGMDVKASLCKLWSFQVVCRS